MLLISNIILSIKLMHSSSLGLAFGGKLDLACFLKDKFLACVPV